MAVGRRYSEPTRPRVLRVIARMNVGGPARQVVELARGLDADRFDQRLLVGRAADGEADYLDLRAGDVPRVSVEGLGRAPKPADDVRALAAIAAEVRRFRPDIVHTHTAKAGVLGRLPAVLHRVPVRVHTFHGHLLHGYFSPTVTRAVVVVEQVLASRTTALVAVGAQVRDELLAAGVGRPGQYSVVPPGISLGAVPSRTGARATLGIPPGAFVVGAIGRLVAIKRPDRLVETARRVVAAMPDAVFLVAGDGPERAAAEAAAADLGARVRFLGWRADVEVVLAASDVVVVTSDNEGMPVSLIEAGLAARPAVTTDVGSAREVVVDGETGFVVAPDAAALAAAVVRLALDPDLRVRLGAAARVWTTDRFSAARLVADTESLYDGLLAASPARSVRRWA